MSHWQPVSSIISNENYRPGVVFEAGRFDGAAAKYKEILDSLPSGNSLVPLTRLNLAQSFEEGGQYDQAIAE